MHIESVAIENFKGFLARQTLNFEPGFNLLVGANNSGKTTVLDVLDLQPGLDDPHRSERTIPQYGGAAVGVSKYEVAVSVRFEELRQMVGWQQLLLPVVEPNPNSNRSRETLLAKLQAFASGNMASRWQIAFENSFGTSQVSGDDGVVFGVADPRLGNGALLAARFTYVEPNSVPTIEYANFAGSHHTVSAYYHQFRDRIYRFSARRQPGVEHGNSGSARLDREAVSLPYCINHLQTNDAHGHRLLCEWIGRIFPSVKWVQSPPIGTGLFQLRCLPQMPEARREDLATPLAKMGTGIGNILAMLYVVLTSREPQVIAIDEPNAFLHPRALRELLAILESEGRQHQYLLTAHSADVLTAVSAKTVSLLDFDGVATSVTQVGPKNLHALRGGLADLGIRVTDLHAKDRVLWVEGSTEELVMPDLLRFACPEIAAGTAVLRVERTGTFSKKGVDPTEVALLYERLSSSSALVPPMVCILLDAETRSEGERVAIERGSQGKLRFLDRRMIENYLLDSSAIASVMNELGEKSTNVDIETALFSALELSDGAVDFKTVDGAAVLANIFSTMSETRQEFRKTRDVPALVEYLIEHEPEKLASLRECLRRTCDLPAHSREPR